MVASIRSDDEKGEIDAMILREARLVINLGYVPDWSPQEFADVLDAFRVALRDLPRWAVGHAFFEWRRTRPRRPSPAEIRILAQRAIEPITEELARRRKVSAQNEQASSRKPAVSKDRADEIMAEKGFNPRRLALVRRFPMARTVAEADEKAEAQAILKS